MPRTHIPTLRPDSLGLCAVCCLAVLRSFGVDPCEFRAALARAVGFLKSAVLRKPVGSRTPAAIPVPVRLFLTLGDKLACKRSALPWAGPCPPHTL